MNTDKGMLHFLLLFLAQQDLFKGLLEQIMYVLHIFLYLSVTTQEKH